jgi:tripartite ATP-independent transporter DctM subunit
MGVEVLTAIYFLGLLVFIFAGLPIAFVLGGLPVIFIYFTWGPQAFYMVVAQTWGSMSSFSLLALPLYIFMAMILERSGVATDLYDMMYLWFGSLRGGLAIGTLVICAIFAAMCGVTGAAVVSMGTIALPSMLSRGYDKKIAVGCINAGGGWGILIPPSVIMIVYGLIAEESVGRLYAGGIFPGLLMLVLLSIYIATRCFFQPELAPAIPFEQRGDWEKKLKALKAVILPFLVVLMVLGSIMAGIATVTEAAAMGVFGAVISAAVHRKLNWSLTREAALRTFKITGMILWIIFGSHCFNAAYQGIGASALIQGLLPHVPGGRWGLMIFFQILVFIMAMVMDSGGIILILTPIFLPTIKALGFDPVWFGICFVINLEIGYMTPPFGMNLFYMKGIVPRGVSMGDIYRSVIPFAIVEYAGLILIMVFPGIAMWLPYKLF